MRQLFALQQRQCDNKIEHQGQEKIWKILRPHCLNGVDTSNIDIWDELKTWSRCRGSAVAWPALEKRGTVFFIVFLSANETYFTCKGEHCLQTWKDDRKIFNNLAGKPGRIFARQRAKYSILTPYKGSKFYILHFRRKNRMTCVHKLVIIVLFFILLLIHFCGLKP